MFLNFLDIMYLAINYHFKKQKNKKKLYNLALKF